MTNYPKPVFVKKQRSRIWSGPDWEWEAWKQAVCYPHLRAMYGSINFNPQITHFTCQCEVCKYSSPGKVCSLDLLEKPDKWGKLWHPHNFDVHHINRRGSHPEDKFSITNSIAIHHDCHRREHGQGHIN